MGDRRRSAWPWILLALLLVVLLLWWLWPEAAVEGPTVDLASDEAPDVAAVEPMETPVTPEPRTTGEEVPRILVVDVLAAPDTWMGRTVQGRADVESVPTDRGFWIQADGERLFVVLDEQGDEVPVHVEAGSTLQIAAAEVHTADDLDRISGNLDPETRSILEDQEVFLTTDDADLTFVGEEAGGTGGATGGSSDDAGS